MAGHESKDKSAPVLDAINSLVDFQVLPGGYEFNASGWLRNFSAEERPVAVHLLNRFQFFSTKLTAELFRSAFASICGTLCARSNDTKEKWGSFLDEILITFPTGEAPNPGDSGNQFARICRQQTSVPREKIVFPDQALRELAEGHDGPLVFVDDFIGTGNQFVETWTRRLVAGSVGPASFEEAFREAENPVYVAVCLATEDGIKFIEEHCPNVRVMAGNVLSRQYSLFDKESLLLPSELRKEGLEIIKTTSHKAGYVDTGGDQNDWRGFEKQGLAIAFQHSVPDATLPLFYSETQGWVPLVIKR